MFLTCLVLSCSQPNANVAHLCQTPTVKTESLSFHIQGGGVQGTNVSLMALN